MKTILPTIIILCLLASNAFALKVKTNNDYGLVEVITEPRPDFTPEGLPILQADGSFQLVWTVLLSIQSERDVRTETDTIWLHAVPGYGRQFTGWLGTESPYTNPIEVNTSQTETVTANFEAIPELNQCSPAITGWLWNEAMGGWVYVSSDTYPYIWNDLEKAWWKFEKEQQGRRHFSVSDSEGNLIKTVILNN